MEDKAAKPSCASEVVGKWDLDRDYPVPIVAVLPDEAAACRNWKAATAWAKANLRGSFTNLYTGWLIQVGSNGIQEGIHRLAASGFPEAIAGLSRLIVHAIPVHTDPDLRCRPDIHVVHTLIAPLIIGKTLFRATLTVRESSLFRRYHGHRIESFGIEMPEDLGEVRRHDQLGFSHPPGSINLRHLLRGIKAPCEQPD